MPPPAKRTKLAHGEAVEFTVPGAQTDVRLIVFGQEFLAHSLLLKAGSAFFRKFLDRANDVSLPAACNQYQYTWYTEVDADGSWCMTSDPNKAYDVNTNTYKGDIAVQTSAFRKMLCAIFSYNYEIANCADLILITDIADYYCALPMISKSVYRAFYRSTGLADTIGLDPCKTLIAAYRLRNAHLFQDALIHALGPWTKPRYEDLKQSNFENLFQFAEKAHLEMFKEINAAETGLLKISANVFVGHTFGDYRSGPAVGKKIVELAVDCVDGMTQVAHLPLHYRNCFKLRHSPNNLIAGQAVNAVLDPVLKNNLAIVTNAVAGEGAYSDFFLFHKVEEFPWDEAELDW